MESTRLLGSDGSINKEHPPGKPTGCKRILMSIGAYLTLFCMMACWICEGEFSQSLTDGCPGGDNSTFPGKTDICYQSHFFVAYCTRLGWSMIFVVWYIWKCTMVGNPTAIGQLPNGKVHKGKGLGAFGWKAYIKWSALLGVAIFGSTYTWYLSLPITSVAGNSAVYQSAPVFVFLFSIPLLNEKVTIMKCISVLLCVGGSAVVAVEQAGGGKDKIVGYVWCILSVVLYAGFEVLYKKYACSDLDPYPLANSQRFFGMCGVAAVVTMWPLFFILDRIQYEPFEWPSTDALRYIFIVVFADVGFNLFLLMTILLSSPLFASVGTILVIPLTALVDYLWKDSLLVKDAFFGVGMIVIGFVCMLYAEHQEHSKKKVAETLISNDIN